MVFLVLSLGVGFIECIDDVGVFEIWCKLLDEIEGIVVQVGIVLYCQLGDVGFEQVGGIDGYYFCVFVLVYCY